MAPVLPGVWTTTRRDSTSRSHTGSIVACADDEFEPWRRHARAQALGGKLSQAAQLGARSLAALQLQELRMTGDCGLGLLLDLRQPQDGQPVLFLPRRRGRSPAGRSRPHPASGRCDSWRGSRYQQSGRSRPEQQPPADPTAAGTAGARRWSRSEHGRPRARPHAPSPDQPGLRQGIGQSLELRLPARLQQLID